MDPYLIDLINRMNETSDLIMKVGFKSEDTISWKATREAEKLIIPEYIDQLASFLEIEKDKKKRRQACFILGHLAKNTGNEEIVIFLINRIEKESDKYILSALLEIISMFNKPKGTNLIPILNAIKSDKWLIRHSAIQALKFSKDDIAENALIEILESSDDPYNLTYANSTLYNIGTIRAIPSLEKHLKSRKRDVRDSARYAIEEIKKRCNL
jgi:HEAT repeat protein